MKHFTYRIKDNEMYDKLKEKAKKEDKSLQNLFTQFIKKYINNKVISINKEKVKILNESVNKEKIIKLIKE